MSKPKLQFEQDIKDASAPWGDASVRSSDDVRAQSRLSDVERWPVSNDSQEQFASELRAFAW